MRRQRLEFSQPGTSQVELSVGRLIASPSLVTSDEWVSDLSELPLWGVALLLSQVSAMLMPPKRVCPDRSTPAVPGRCPCRTCRLRGGIQLLRRVRCCRRPTPRRRSCHPKSLSTSATHSAGRPDGRWGTG